MEGQKMVLEQLEDMSVDDRHTLLVRVTRFLPSYQSTWARDDLYTADVAKVVGLSVRATRREKSREKPFSLRFGCADMRMSSVGV
jgi:hypothetical protein